MSQKITSECPHCDSKLLPNHVGPCPECGKEGKSISAHFAEIIRVSDRFGLQTRKTYYEHHKPSIIVNLILAVGSPFLGLWLAGWSGVVVGILISIVSYWLGPKATSKVIEIMKGPNQ